MSGNKHVPPRFAKTSLVRKKLHVIILKEIVFKKN